MKLFVKWEKERERWGGAAADPRDPVGTRAHCWLGSRVLRTETPRLHQAHREPQSQLQPRMFCELSLSCPGCFRYLCPIHSYNKLRQFTVRVEKLRSFRDRSLNEVTREVTREG